MNPAALRSVMTEAEYDAARAKLHDLYGETLSDMVARRDQALAQLFARSGWTQEKLAKKEGKGQQWVSRRLLFGRFLSFTPMGVNAGNLPANLTERRFRELWSETDQNEGNERIRFQQVLKRVQENIRLGDTTAPKGYSKIIREKFADGEWYPLSEIAEAIGTSPKDAAKTIRKIRDIDVEHRLKPSRYS